MKTVNVSQSLESKQDTQSIDFERIKFLSTLPFWCHDNTLHERMKDYRKNGCCFTHTVGLPRKPKTGEVLPLTPYQVEFAETVINNRAGTTDSRKYHLNKGRQMGFTEIVLRVIQYLCLHAYAGYHVGIIAATNGELARKDLRRFEELFAHVPELVYTPIANRKIVLTTGTEVEAFRASEEAITGDTFYKGILMDEAAKWKNRSDAPLFNSIMPIIDTNGADLFLVSTPKGPVKTFYEIHKEPKDFIKMTYDLWCAAGNLYTPEHVQYMIDNATQDANQEYLCKFTFGSDAVFGEVGPEDRSDDVVEWRVNEDGIADDEEWAPQITR